MASKQLRKGEMPAITIRYSPSHLNKYLRYLHSQGCKILITNPVHRIIAEYNPSTQKNSPPPTSIDGLSPRSRHIATHGQHPTTDKIIRQAADDPAGHKLIWLPSHKWEQKMIETIQKAAKIKGFDLSEITAAEAVYTGSELKIRSVSTPRKGAITVNQEL